MSKKYYIKFNTGKEVTGTAKEIVTQLRNESRLLAITPGPPDFYLFRHG